MSSSDSDSPRDFADRFRVERRLGRGGMGDVYKAYDTVLERTVAVKTLTPGNAGSLAVERLLREARACARLTHAGIVTIHDVLRVEGSVHIVMEHLEGASLESLHRFPRLSKPDAKIDVIIRILDALHYAHGRGVVHRDIKPSNVQVLPDGSVKLLDFGIAHIAGAAALTVTGTTTGTAHYASPEQLRGEESDAGTDIYSTGILAYELLTRRRPFDGDSVATVLTKVLHDPLPAMGTSFGEHFPEIERIIRRATAKRREDRYGGAEDMRNAFTAFLASSREAIVTRQAETAATAQRLVVEAKSLISGGRTAEALPLLTSALRSNPDAEEARELLRTGEGASADAARPSTAARAEPGSTRPPGPDATGTAATVPAAATDVTAGATAATDMTAGAMSGTAATAPTAATDVTAGAMAGTATGLDAAAGFPARVPSSRRPGFLPVAAAAAAIVLVAAVLLGPDWMPSGSPGDAPSPAGAPSAPQPGPESVATGTAALESPVSASSLSASTDEAAGGGREGAAGAAVPSRPAVAASPPAPAPATARRPAPPPASPAVTAPAAGDRPSPAPASPAAPAPAPGAKDLYYAATPPGAASPAGAEAAAPAQAGAGRPGIRYRILRRDAAGAAVETDADTLFRSGDRIRFAFEPNIDGFLYVVQRGSTGRWCLLLPHPQINGGRNFVTRYDEVEIPPAGVGWFTFDENPGSETLFVYLSREPSVSFPWGGGRPAGAECVDQPTIIELSNSVRTRDLVFEKEAAAGSADRSAYVVNQGEVGHAVAWTVELRHR